MAASKEDLDVVNKNSLPRYGLVLVAAGTGKRMATQTPKQYLLLAGKPVIVHTLERFITTLPECEIVIVYNPLHASFRNQLCEQYPALFSDITWVEGGKERFDSVKQGLSQIRHAQVIGIHDSVRPFVSRELIVRLYQEAEKHGSAIPLIHPADSVRHEVNGKYVYVARDRVGLVQTPQCFLKEWLDIAYRNSFRPEFTDDARVVEFTGFELHFISGDKQNIKITDSVDWQIAESLIKLT